MQDPDQLGIECPAKSKIVVACDGLTITGTGAIGTLDMTNGNHLVWDGVDYLFWSTNV